MKFSSFFSSFILLVVAVVVVVVVVISAAATPATATSSSGIRGGAAATATTASTGRKLEDGIPSASHKLLIATTDRGTYIQNFEYNGNPLIDGDGNGLTPDAKKLLYGSMNDMAELVAFKDMTFNNGCGGKDGSAFDNLSYDGSSPPVNPPAVEIQEDFDCQGTGGTLIDYLLCTADLIDICNGATNCELKPGPICSCTKSE